jgi:hypothetical protein
MYRKGTFTESKQVEAKHEELKQCEPMELENQEHHHDCLHTTRKDLAKQLISLTQVCENLTYIVESLDERVKALEHNQAAMINHQQRSFMFLNNPEESAAQLLGRDKASRYKPSSYKPT